MGDSLTAAFGAKATSLLDLFNDWRGVSFSIGGDEDADRVLTVSAIKLIFLAYRTPLLRLQTY